MRSDCEAWRNRAGPQSVRTSARAILRCLRRGFGLMLSRRSESAARRQLNGKPSPSAPDAASRASAPRKPTSRQHLSIVPMIQARLLAVVLLSSLAASTTSSPPGSLFDEYPAKDSAASNPIRNVSDFPPLLDQATAASSSWPVDVGAAYLLEVSAAAFFLAEWFPRLPGPSLGRVISFSGVPFGTNRRTNCIGLSSWPRSSPNGHRRTRHSAASGLARLFLFSKVWARYRPRETCRRLDSRRPLRARVRGASGTARLDARPLRRADDSDGARKYLRG